MKRQEITNELVELLEKGIETDVDVEVLRKYTTDEVVASSSFPNVKFNECIMDMRIELEDMIAEVTLAFKCSAETKQEMSDMEEYDWKLDEEYIVRFKFTKNEFQDKITIDEFLKR